MKSILALCLAVLAAACGEGTLVFGVGPKEDSISVTGTINNVTPPNATRDIVVFVFTNLRDPGTFRSFTDAESVVVASGSNQFTLSGVSPGDLTVVFLLDDVTPDGSIDPGDPFATLEDPNRVLENVSGGRTVQIEAVDITFESDADGGTASAERIRTTTGSGT
ncbi:MAG: hypothetical protein D6815_11845 [Candidatus Dadabacteria bacterium]|nr:MAG: hypothetical protein D6815_11845 [Candidatus Dadabacteria bacterium]